MNYTMTGLLAGILLALAAIAGDLTGFLLAVVLGGIGFGLGAWRDGLLDSFRRGRSGV